MREEGISSSGDPLLFRNSSPRPPTPAASSAGASSPAVATNAGSTDWLGSKVGSISRIGSQPMWISLSGNSVLGSSQPSCRPWERGDLLRRLSTFRPANWFGKPKAASSLACARRGWVNVDIDQIECESCNATLKYIAPDSWTPTEGENCYNLGEEFGNELDEGHKVICPWRGNSCAESLVQFPPTPPSALIGGYKDRCDGLFQFLYLPIVAGSTLEQMRVSRGPEIDRFLVQSYTFTAGEFGCKADIASGSENNREEALCVYSRAQKLISLCGWEPIWAPNVQDCEEHSAQSARNGCSFSPINKDCPPPDLPNRKQSKKAALVKNDQAGPTSKLEPRSPLLDCSLCGATVRIFDFLTVTRPAPNIPETGKKMALTRGVSAASGINGWVAADLEEAATTSNIGVDLDLTMGGGFSTGNPDNSKRVVSEQYININIGQDLVIGQPAGSEVGDRAASYESRGPSTRKRNLDEGGSTVDRPPQQADSVEGVVIDRDGDEVNDSKHKRVRDHFNYRKDLSSSGAGPSQVLYFDIERGPQQQQQGNSARASSVIAMDTVYQNEDNDSMESVENHPGDDVDVDIDDATFKSPDLNDNDNNSDLNVSIQAQQSTCPGTVRAQGVSSTNDDEVLNENTRREGGVSLGMSGGSVGMGASHEAEIHGGVDHRTESVTENQGQNGEFAADFVPEEDGMSRADSGSKVVGKAAEEYSVENTSNMHLSVSCNAVVCSGFEVSKDEVTQAGKSDECGFTNGIGIEPPNGESNFEEAVEFDPIKHHNFFCPWVNGNVAAAGVVNGGLALCGWQLTLDALDGFKPLEPNQTVESESAASLYKDDRQVSGRKLISLTKS